ncbi:hypothetical protein FHL15_009579 [Xylaria flabelliformis]|uniref:Uncharacterized protein n=1 Tax=Xylaria flabelliformis TaxID=2512241 RepID=A0A553HNJ7_9PEZI|nr:hypothetical protein FHL15_009579 [Xylaria flabelliformis]
MAINLSTGDPRPAVKSSTTDLSAVRYATPKPLELPKGAKGPKDKERAEAKEIACLVLGIEFLAPSSGVLGHRTRLPVVAVAVALASGSIDPGSANNANSTAQVTNLLKYVHTYLPTYAVTVNAPPASTERGVELGAKFDQPETNRYTANEWPTNNLLAYRT